MGIYSEEPSKNQRIIEEGIRKHENNPEKTDTQEDTKTEGTNSEDKAKDNSDEKVASKDNDKKEVIKEDTEVEKRDLKNSTENLNYKVVSENVEEGEELESKTINGEEDESLLENIKVHKVSFDEFKINGTPSAEVFISKSSIENNETSSQDKEKLSPSSNHTYSNLSKLNTTSNRSIQKPDKSLDGRNSTSPKRNLSASNSTEKTPNSPQQKTKKKSNEEENKIKIANLTGKFPTKTNSLNIV